ncbi:hypothetical protein CGT93_16740 [Vibrio metoecus]|nr:hypothetical protein CGT93_16740 [Vibrio metoecus]
MDGGVSHATSRYFIIKQSTRCGGLIVIADGGIFQRDRFLLRRNFLPTKQDLAQTQAAFCFIDGDD